MAMAVVPYVVLNAEISSSIWGSNATTVVVSMEMDVMKTARLNHCRAVVSRARDSNVLPVWNAGASPMPVFETSAQNPASRSTTVAIMVGLFAVSVRVHS